MTNGTSQGLLVIVAVVIFGIFVGISYILFGEKLNTGLAHIFTDSLEQSENSLNGKDSNTGGDNSNVDDGIDTSIFKFDKNTGTILGFKQGYKHTSTSLTIPSKIDGVEVKKIGKDAFRISKLTSLTLNSNLEVIEDSAFLTSKLTELEIPDSVKEIDYLAFSESPLKSLKLPKNLTKLGEGAFNRALLTELEIPDSIKEIQRNTFLSSPLKSLKLPKNVEKIGTGAFKESKLENKLDKNEFKSLSEIGDLNPIFK